MSTVLENTEHPCTAVMFDLDSGLIALPYRRHTPPPNPLDENCSYRAWIAIYLTYDTIAWRIRLRVLHYFTQGLSRASELKNRENRIPRRRGRKTNSSKNREFSIRIGTLEKNLKSNVLRYRRSAIARNHESWIIVSGVSNYASEEHWQRSQLDPESSVSV